MAKFDDEELALGKVYAAALFALTVEQKNSQAIGEELAELAALIDHRPEFATFLSSPTVEMQVRKKTLEKAFRGRLSDLVVDGLQVLNRGSRLGLIGAIAAAFADMEEDRAGGVTVQVRTASPLSEAARRRLTEVLGKRTGKSPRIHDVVDPRLLGGVVVQVGDYKFDASVSRKLAELSAGMLERASREIQSGREYITA